mgnify:CR=1 FL=1
MDELKACHCCGLIHRIPTLDQKEVATCSRCDARIARGARVTASRSAQRTAAVAFSALLLYWPAILLPILETERFGHRSTASLLGGTIDLIRHGSWFVGGVVLLFSIVFPLVKIVLLLELSFLELFPQTLRGPTYRLMESAGKWSIMDVMLLAFLVMLVKIGEMVEFHIGPAIFAFVGCVALSMIASLTFDPHVIWERS